MPTGTLMGGEIGRLDAASSVDGTNDVIPVLKADGSVQKATADQIVNTGGIRQLTVVMDDISTAGSAFTVSPYVGNITKIQSVIDGAIATADAGITTEIGGVAITGGAITIANSGSAAGDVDTASPSAANTLAVGDALEVITDGASTNTVKGTFVFTVTL